MADTATNNVPWYQDYGGTWVRWILDGFDKAHKQAKTVAIVLTSTILLCIVSSMLKQQGGWFKYKPVLYLATLILIVASGFFILSKDARTKHPELLQNGVFAGQMLMLAGLAADLNFLSVLIATAGTVVGGYFAFIHAKRWANDKVREELTNNAERMRFWAPLVSLILNFLAIAFFIYYTHRTGAMLVFGVSAVMLGISAVYLLLVYMPFFTSLLALGEEEQKFAAVTLYLELARIYFWGLMLLAISKK